MVGRIQTVAGWCVAFTAIFLTAALYAGGLTGRPLALCLYHPVDPMPVMMAPLIVVAAMGATFLVGLYQALGAPSVCQRVRGIGLAIAMSAVSVGLAGTLVTMVTLPCA